MEQKKILLIGTGGTIASEMGESGLTPELTSEQLLRYIPDISGICQVACLQLFSLDSTNIQPKHWARIAGAIRERYREKYSGEPLLYCIRVGDGPSLQVDGREILRLKASALERELGELELLL